MQVYVLNHKSRSPKTVVDLVQAQGYVPTVSTDRSDYNLLRDRDTRWQGLYDNYRVLLGMIAQQPASDGWGVILHDDVSVPDGLLKRIEHVLQFAQPTMISFYNPHNNLFVRAMDEGHRVVTTFSNFWTQCFCFHQSVCQPLIDWGTEHVVVGVCAEDGYIKRFASRTGVPIQVIVPSLIQHEGYARSTYRLPAKVGRFERRSATYDPDFDVFAVDWPAEFAKPLADRSKLMTMDGLKGF